MFPSASTRVAAHIPSCHRVPLRVPAVANSCPALDLQPPRPCSLPPSAIPSNCPPAMRTLMLVRASKQKARVLPVASILGLWYCSCRVVLLCPWNVYLEGEGIYTREEELVGTKDQLEKTTTLVDAEGKVRLRASGGGLR
ncbi:hypothetical protein PIB30_044567 [Stylosanthes scabra]|uniref:Uncharacterized protein n=1 Tax=Stylosanthes scabra TaxID=79078 RepID=A0ABU6WFW9_9FABA|nr:hypothetical protein [Stylosanthes scabra]